MGADAMTSEFPDKEQRAAVCHGSWDKMHKTNNLQTRTKLVRLEARQDLTVTKKLNGKDYLVAPVVPLVEGVHNDEFIPYEEMAIFPGSWDGRPLPIDHPVDADGKAVTANSPKVMEDSVVGSLFNVIAREDLNGISGEIWIDIEKANSVPGGAEVLRKLQAGEGLEVSTGYFTFINNVPGEWKNPKTGSIEKYTGSQYGVRPDHLALLPFDKGACSWKDGCGSPRMNNDIPVQSEIRGDTMPADKKELTVNGKQLGKVLKGMLAAHTGDDGTPTAMMQRLAAACGCDMPKMEALIDGTLDFAPQSWLKIMAAVLDVDLWDLFMAASNDNSDARYAENIPAVASQEKNIPAVKTEVTISDTDKSNGTETTEELCGPCKKSLKVKVQELVTSTLKAMGIERIEPAKQVPVVDKSEEILMEKKVRVETLIASDKTRFSEDHREWLMSLSDDQLTLLTPAADTAPASAVSAAAPAAAAIVVQKEEVKEVTATVPTKAQILEALGISEDALAATQNIVNEKKAARANKVAEILAAEGNPYTEAELKNMGDALLEKVAMTLQPVAIRVAAGRPNVNAQIPPTPPIMLAAPDKGRAN